MKSTEDRFDLAHVTTVHNALDSRIFYREALSASKAGIRTVVIGPSPESTIFCGVSIVALPRIQLRFIRRLVAPFLAFKQILRLKPKIVHFHDPEIILVALLLKLIGYKVVWDVHEFYSEVRTAHMRDGLFKRIKRAVISLLVEKGPCAVFDKSVFPTHALRAAIWDRSSAVACVNLLPISEFPDDHGEHAKEYDLIFVGSMSPFRATPFMEMLVELLKLRPAFRAAILGVPEATKKWMYNNAPSIEVLSAIVFLPRVPHSEVASVIRRARIGFNYHPMQKRFQVALPMKVYEYMACGVPVVCSRFPELAQQVTTEEMILIDGDNQLSYAEAIHKLLNDPDGLRNLAKAGQEAVRMRLNWEQSEVPKLLAMYRELLC